MKAKPNVHEVMVILNDKFVHYHRKISHIFKKVAENISDEEYEKYKYAYIRNENSDELTEVEKFTFENFHVINAKYFTGGETLVHLQASDWLLVKLLQLPCVLHCHEVDGGKIYVQHPDLKLAVVVYEQDGMDITKGFWVGKMRKACEDVNLNEKEHLFTLTRIPENKSNKNKFKKVFISILATTEVLKAMGKDKDVTVLRYS